MNEQTNSQRDPSNTDVSTQVAIAVMRERLDGLRATVDNSISGMQATFSARLDHMEQRFNTELKEGRIELLTLVKEQISELKTAVGEQKREGAETKGNVQKILTYAAAFIGVAVALGGLITFFLKIAEFYTKLPLKP